MGDVQTRLVSVDKRATGTYRIEDKLTVTSPSMGVDGHYPVKRIERNLLDPDWVQVDLGVRQPEEWEAVAEIRRMVKDLSTL